MTRQQFESFSLVNCGAELKKYNKRTYKAQLDTAFTGLKMLYEDVRNTDIAKELGISRSWVTKMRSSYEAQLAGREPYISKITKAYLKVHRKPARMSSIKPTETKINTKPKKYLGFVFNGEEIARINSAVRSSVLFMQKYGHGKENGYNLPHNVENENEGFIWLDLRMASHYCQCSEKDILKAYKAGKLTRRICGRVLGLVYYEYRLDRLRKLAYDLGR